MDASSAVTPMSSNADIELVRQLRAFAAWVGSGRALTQTGRVKLADARELVPLLETGDELDPMDGRFKTTSSADLPGLSLIVAWATACGLVRVVRGRLVGVKKNARLLKHPAELWERMFETFGQIGEALCRDGWGQSLMRLEFAEVTGAVLRQAHRRGGSIALADAGALAWEIAASHYHLEHCTEMQLSTARQMNDRDARYALETLQRLGAATIEDDTATLTAAGQRMMRRAGGEPEPGDAIVQLKISLLGVKSPPVWRRVLVPADIRLDRLHGVIQTAMGWLDCHLHAFEAAGVEYGPQDPRIDLDHRDERKATLARLVAVPGDRMRYTYDFGDDWEHEILVEKLLSAEPGVRYPACTAGKGRRPPEDCGGPWGYASLRETLADPDDDEHPRMLEWLGLDSAAQFDPTAFDLEEANDLLEGAYGGRS